MTGRTFIRMTSIIISMTGTSNSNFLGYFTVTFLHRSKCELPECIIEVVDARP